MKIPRPFSFNTEEITQPFNSKIILRILVLLIVILALAAGYFHSAWQLENKKFLLLEDKYIRVRDILGKEETQRLIDLSQELEKTTNQIP